MRNNMALGWFYSPSQICRYFLTRISSLRPPRTKMQNPVAILRQLDSHQWLMFLAGFVGWYVTMLSGSRIRPETDIISKDVGRV
jgi:SHS family lactate transporter-like MFS transporter